MSSDVMTSAVRGLVRLSRAVEHNLAKDQLSLSQFRILDRLATGSFPGRSLAEWLAVKPPALTALVDALVKRGLVDRAEDPSDRRQVTHTLTAEGIELHREVSTRLGDRLMAILGHSQDEAGARALIEALAEWDRVLDAALAAREVADRGGGQ